MVVMGGAATTTAILITGQIKDKYSILLNTAYQEMKDNKRTIYVALNDIMAGDYITNDNVAVKTVYSEQPEDTYITEEDLNKVAIINIRAGTGMLKSMLSANTISSELRELEYTVINISSNILNNDSVDVRLSYPNGESYVVLSKKLMKGYIPETSSCYLWLDEEELLRMSAAIVDASLYTGSKLFVTKYIEPNIQSASIVNYTPSLSILSLLESDPNILARASQDLSREVRKSLENRLADSLDPDVANINWDINPNLMVTPVPNELDTDADTDIIQDLNQETEQVDDTSLTGTDAELGSIDTADDYFYYAEEQEAKEGDIEYGE